MRSDSKIPEIERGSATKIDRCDQQAQRVRLWKWRMRRRLMSHTQVVSVINAKPQEER